MNLEKLYDTRFNPSEKNRKSDLWGILCEKFFSKYISQKDCILDIGSGYCEFINHIGTSCAEPFSGKKIAVDLNPAVSDYAAADVEVHNCKAQELSFIKSGTVDVVFVSNFFEHVREKEEILLMIVEFRRVLRTNGKLMILQPNIKYLYKEYWDFFDHYTPLSHHSMREAIEIVGGFKITKMIPRFLPYTTKSNLPQRPFLIRLYLALPFTWKIMGKQMFVIAEKTNA